MHNTSGVDTGVLAGFILVYALFIIAILVFTIYIQWRIASKAGYPGAYSLLLLIPLVNLIVLIIFAFSEWPIQRALRMATGGGGYPPPGGGSYIPPGGGGYAPPATMPPPNPYAPPAPPEYPPQV
jgi:hypothetical protein